MSVVGQCLATSLDHGLALETENQPDKREMTWQSILDERLLRYDSITRAAIFGRDGACYASSSDLTVGRAMV